MLSMCVVDSQELCGKGLYGDDILQFLSGLDVVVMMRGPTFKDTDASASLVKVLETYAGTPLSHMFLRNSDSTHSTVIVKSDKAKLARWHTTVDGSLHLLVSVHCKPERHVAIRAAPWTSDVETTDIFFMGADADVAIAVVAADSTSGETSYTDGGKVSTKAMNKWSRSVDYICYVDNVKVAAAPISPTPFPSHHPAVDDDDDLDELGDTTARKAAVPVKIDVRFGGMVS